MKRNIKEVIENFSEELSQDVDVISLKALAEMPESDNILRAQEAIIKRLLEKYPDNAEILGLVEKETISLDELLESLEAGYPDNVDVITIKALSSLPDGESKDKAIAKCLERLLESDIEKEKIQLYLQIDNEVLPKNSVPKEKNPNMILVEGGTYVPSFCGEERTTFDIYVSKYDVTNDEWDELMEVNPSKALGARKPVNNIDRIAAMEYCNKMSIKYGLQPVYKIENNKLVKIIYKNGEEEYPNLAEFSKTEGYRLPTEVEWEWFAWGGKIAQEEGTFDKLFYEKNIKPVKSCGDQFMDRIAAFSSRISVTPPDYSLYAWYGAYSITDVGSKKPNELGLYDVIGNVDQHIYDTALRGYIDEKRLYTYDENYAGRTRGGNYSCKIRNKFEGGNLYDRRSTSAICGMPTVDKVGFRVVRTAI